MNTHPLAWAAIAVIVLFAFAGGVSIDPVNPPTPPPAGVPDFYAIFAQQPAAQAEADVAQAADLLESLAKIVEWDGTRPTPALATDKQLEAMRVTMRELNLLGGSFSARYPTFGPAIGDYLQQRVGPEDDDLTAERRGRWVTALRDLAAGCRYAQARF